MASHVLTADRPGAFQLNVGANGSDDSVTVNIGPDFLGVILVNSSFGDGETDVLSQVNLPAGWRLDSVGPPTALQGEGQTFFDQAFTVFNAQGAPVGVLSVRSNNIFVPRAPCFVAGTRILTPQGPVAVEMLRPGDSVVTRDHGAAVLRWVGQRRLSAIDLARAPKLYPVRIAAGALGEGVPERDLWVSPQHRVLLRSAIAQRMFGAPEVLLPAIRLVGQPGIGVVSDVVQVTYVHLLFDRHEIVYSDGAATESLFLGPEALKALDEAARAEILSLFPQVAGGRLPERARHFVTGKPAQRLLARHVANRRAFFA